MPKNRFREIVKESENFERERVGTRHVIIETKSGEFAVLPKKKNLSRAEAVVIRARLRTIGLLAVSVVVAVAIGAILHAVGLI